MTTKILQLAPLCIFITLAIFFSGNKTLVIICLASMLVGLALEYFFKLKILKKIETSKMRATYEMIVLLSLSFLFGAAQATPKLMTAYLIFKFVIISLFLGYLSSNILSYARKYFK